MAEIRKLQVNDAEVYPVTHEAAVYGNDGKTINSKYISSVVYGDDVTLPDADIQTTIQGIEDRLELVENEVEEIKENLENNTSIADKAGNLTDLRTDNKEDIVSAVNELVSDLSDLNESVSNKVDTSTYNSKVAELEAAFNQAFQSGNNAKQQLVDVLIAKDLNVSTNNTFNELINKIGEIKSEGITLPDGYPKWYFTKAMNMWIDTKKTLPLTVSRHASAVIGDCVYIFGGSNGTMASNTVCFNTTTGQVTTKKALATKDYYHTADTVGNYAYLIGGNNAGIGDKATNNYRYDPSTDSFTSQQALPSGGRANHSSAAVNNNIYILGGMSNSTTYNNTNLCYTPSSNSWTTKKVLPAAISYGAAAAVGNKIYFVGGRTSASKYVASTYCYDTTTDLWTTLANLPTQSYGHRCCTVNDKVYMMGGCNSTTYKSTTYCYDPSTNRWEQVASLVAATGELIPIMYHTLETIGGCLYLFGGEAQLTNSTAHTDYILIYLPNLTI